MIQGFVFARTILQVPVRAYYMAFSSLGREALWVIRSLVPARSLAAHSRRNLASAGGSLALGISTRMRHEERRPSSRIRWVKACP